MKFKTLTRTIALFTQHFLSAVIFNKRKIVVKNNIRSMLLLFFVFYSFTAAAGGGISSGNVSKVAFQTGGFYLYSDKGWNNPNNCTNNSAIVLKSTDVNYEKA